MKNKASSLNEVSTEKDSFFFKYYKSHSFAKSSIKLECEKSENRRVENKKPDNA